MKHIRGERLFGGHSRIMGVVGKYISRYLFMTIALVSLGMFWMFPTYVNASDIFDDMTSRTSKYSAASSGGGDVNSGEFSTLFFPTVMKFLKGIVIVVGVGVILYIGYLLATAEGSEEQHKKAWKAIAYLVVGLVVFPLAFVLVQIVTGYDF